jgi:hypothetical protein
MNGLARYRIHRVLPMRLIDHVERWLRRTYQRNQSEWSKRWLDRVAWFTTPYRGARMDSGVVHAMSNWREDRLYGVWNDNTTNIRWELYRVRGDVRYRALGLTGGGHGLGR